MANMLAGYEWTKEKRHEMLGPNSGGANSMKYENFQRKTIEDQTGCACKKTHMRINLENYEFSNNPKISGLNRFEFTEDFDGLQEFSNNRVRVYVNLKCIAGSGGAQTRSLQVVYHTLLKGELEVLLKSPDENLYFANIMDGDVCHKHMPQLQYILSKPKYEKIKHRIYIGDSKGYIDWVNKIIQ